MPLDLSAPALTQFHDAMLADPAWPFDLTIAPPDGVWLWIEANHRYNTLQWEQEVRVRRCDLGPAAIAAGTRLIERYRRRRHEAIDAIDHMLLAALGGTVPGPAARLSSETAGAMVDRLSILAISLLHLRHQAAGAAQRSSLGSERRDLGQCFDALLADAAAGRAYFKVYRPDFRVDF